MGQAEAHAAAGDVEDLDRNGGWSRKGVGSEQRERRGSGEFKTGLAAAFHMGTYRREGVSV